MANIGLEQVHEDILRIKEEIENIKLLISAEELPLSSDLVDEINHSRRRSKKEFISQDEMKKEFG